MTVAEALAGAQRELLASEDYREPFYWAGYTVTGDAESRANRAPGLPASGAEDGDDG